MLLKLNGLSVDVGRFPNGESRFYHAQIEELTRRQDCELHRIQFRYESDVDLLHLMFLKRHLDSVGARSVELLIDYMPYSRMDRSEGGSVFTLRYVTDLINTLGFSKVRVLDPHSDVTMALLDRSEAVTLSYELLTVAMNMAGFDSEFDYVVYPDAGAQKRYARNHPYRGLVCIKQRDFTSGNITSLDLIGDVGEPGFTAIILDDICSYGGTFALTAEQLRSAGAAHVYLCVTHCEDSVYEGRLFKNDHHLIDRIVTTDSILRVPDPTGKIHVLSTDQAWKF